MVVVVQPDLGSADGIAPMRTGRAAWLILAADGPATELWTASSRRSCASSPTRGAFATCCSRNGRGSSSARSRRRTRRRSRSSPRSGVDGPGCGPCTSRRPTPSRTGSPPWRLASTTPSPRTRPRPSSLAASPGSTRDRGPAQGPAARPGRSGRASSSTSRHTSCDAAAQVIHLRPKEFGLLALLAAHPGRAYTRRELLHVVWGPAHIGGPRTVDVHVRWLRSKIEARPSSPALPRDGARRRLPAGRARRTASRGRGR